ncbi:MAG: CerR family C-terminal domain-containing protein [Alphaproteobacteria bacterium]|nr:CerR family C-terminal domain-containing protein [Alphaproteobacteria bacterium]
MEKEDTSAKERLVSSALHHFAKAGYDGASTRTITKDAKVNVAAIPYYFASKEGLYRAVIERLIDIVRRKLGFFSDEAVMAVLNDGTSPEVLESYLHDAVTRLIHFLLVDMDGHALPSLFLREQAVPTAAFSLLYDAAIEPNHKALTALVARLTGYSADSQDACLCTNSIVGLVSIYRTHREMCLRRLGCAAYGKKEIQVITDMALKNVDALVDCHRLLNGLKSLRATA